MRPTFGSLFAGIGGLDLGLERAGWECRWQVEWDEFCTKVLERHWPNVKRYGDCRAVEPSELEAVDLICGGFPCQPVSTAGQGRGEDDPRWLWPEFYRFICGIRPQWALAENVPGLLSINLGRLFGGILRDLATIGYDAEWEVLSASGFGAPHGRRRLFILAHSNEINGEKGLGNIEGQRKILSQDHGECQEIWLQAADRFIGMDDGIPPRLYRYRGEALGNAVVPQVAEWIGRRILEYG